MERLDFLTSRNWELGIKSKERRTRMGIATSKVVLLKERQPVAATDSFWGGVSQGFSPQLWGQSSICSFKPALHQLTNHQADEALRPSFLSVYLAKPCSKDFVISPANVSSRHRGRVAATGVSYLRSTVPWNFAAYPSLHCQRIRLPHTTAPSSFGVRDV